MSGNLDLHGSAPDKSPIALLLIDVINALDFPEAPQLLEFALPMAKKLADFKQSLKAAGIPAVFVNDNFGRWRSDFRAQVHHCLRADSRGRPVVELLQPHDDDYFVLKPKHSAFFSTTLDVLLEYLGAETLIITGVATDICVLFTANDAYMRDYRLLVPADCVAANTKTQNDNALEEMQRVLKADVTPSDELSAKNLLVEARSRQQRALRRTQQAQSG